MIEVEKKVVTVEDLAASMVRVCSARRDALMRDLAGLEEALGYGKPKPDGNGKPTTAQLWQHWRSGRGMPGCEAKR